MTASATFIVTLDIGSSSVRTLLFDQHGSEQPGFGERLTYQFTTTHDGGVEIDPAMLSNLAIQCLDKIHAQMQAAALRPTAIAVDTFWHGLLGIDKTGQPTTPLLHLFDTRSSEQAKQLAARLDPRRVHERTGCRVHASYWPAKLMWLSQARPDAFTATVRWLSCGEFLFLQLFGHAAASTSMISATGLWNQIGNEYDEELLPELPIRRDQLPPPAGMDAPMDRLLPAFAQRWPLFDSIPWFPALGDGACNNIGSGCTSVNEFALMVGTSGAMRAVVEAAAITIPEGLWCYRVDRRRFVLGGALSNGGDVYAWMRRTLALPPAEECERAIAQSKPGSHGLLLLPFFAGERSPYWRADLRAAITGIDFSTTALDILQAALESVALRFREIFELMTSSLGAPETVVASGGAMLASPAWTRMMCDALSMRLITCLEEEATSRGAALLALERLGVIESAAHAPYQCGPVLQPDAQNPALYTGLLAAQRKLFTKLYIEP